MVEDQALKLIKINLQRSECLLVRELLRYGVGSRRSRSILQLNRPDQLGFSQWIRQQSRPRRTTWCLGKLAYSILFFLDKQLEIDLELNFRFTFTGVSISNAIWRWTDQRWAPEEEMAAFRFIELGQRPGQKRLCIAVFRRPFQRQRVHQFELEQHHSLGRLRARQLCVDTVERESGPEGDHYDRMDEQLDGEF